MEGLEELKLLTNKLSETLSERRYEKLPDLRIQNYNNDYHKDLENINLEIDLKTTTLRAITDSPATIRQQLMQYRISSSTRDSSGNYYVAGVLFMISVIGLLLYVNLYYENCFRDTCFQMSKWRVCCFIRHFFKPISSSTQKRNQNQINVSNANNNEKASLGREQAGLIDVGSNFDQYQVTNNNNTNSTNNDQITYVDMK